MKVQAFLLAFLFSTSTLAAGGYVGPANSSPASGYTGPSVAPRSTITTVAEALKARDDAQVALQGQIIRHLNREKYEFTDNTGTIRVEIDDDLWPQTPVSEKTTVKLYGEVDRGRRGVEIDVDHLEIVR